MVWNNGRLLHRPKETEGKDGEMFCSELDSTTLKVSATFEHIVLKFYTVSSSVLLKGHAQKYCVLK